MLGLEPGARDPALTILIEIVSAAALHCFKPNRQQLALLRARLQLEDVAASTTMLARSLHWTAQLFSLNRPALYLDEGEAGPLPLPIQDPAWVVGRGFGKGTHQGNLAFHWARSLAKNSGTARVLRLHPDADGMSHLLSACLAAVKKQPLTNSPDVLDLALALRQKLSLPELRSLLSVLEQAPAAEWQRRLHAFLQEVVFCSNRAGLLACGDPAIAANALTSYDLEPDVRDEQLADLFIYATSDAYAELRKRLGIAHGA